MAECPRETINVYVISVFAHGWAKERNIQSLNTRFSQRESGSIEAQEHRKNRQAARQAAETRIFTFEKYR